MKKILILCMLVLGIFPCTQNIIKAQANPCYEPGETSGDAYIVWVCCDEDGNAADCVPWRCNADASCYPIDDDGNRRSPVNQHIPPPGGMNNGGGPTTSGGPNPSGQPTNPFNGPPYGVDPSGPPDDPGDNNPPDDPEPPVIGPPDNNNGNPPSACPKVTFNEDITQSYGFDNYTSLTHKVWKSIESNKSDKLSVRVIPPSDYNKVFFKSLSVDDLTVDPTNATSPLVDLTISASLVDENEESVTTDVDANCENINGENIDKFKVVAYRLVTKTVNVTLVHAAGDQAGYNGYQSTPVNEEDIKKYLNDKYYNQGVVHWNVHVSPDATVDFDLDKDGTLFNYYVPIGWSVEQQAIVDACQVSGYDINLFLVDNPKKPGTYGVSLESDGISFAYPMLSPGVPAPDVINTIAHELGHSGFGLEHSDSGDKENLMLEGGPTPIRNKFRVDQWDLMHKK